MRNRKVVDVTKSKKGIILTMQLRSIGLEA